MFRQEEKSRGLMHVQFPPEREFVTSIIDAWGHHNRARPSDDKFDIRATVKKCFLTSPPSPPSPAPSTLGGASHPIPQGDPFEQELGRGLRLRVRAAPSGKCEKIINVLATGSSPWGTGGGLRPPGRPIRKWEPLRVAPMGRLQGIQTINLV